MKKLIPYLNLNKLNKSIRLKTWKYRRSKYYDMLNFKCFSTVGIYCKICDEYLSDIEPRRWNPHRERIKAINEHMRKEHEFEAAVTSAAGR